MTYMYSSSAVYVHVHLYYSVVCCVLTTAVPSLFDTSMRVLVDNIDGMCACYPPCMCGQCCCVAMQQSRKWAESRTSSWSLYCRSERRNSSHTPTVALVHMDCCSVMCTHRSTCTLYIHDCTCWLVQLYVLLSRCTVSQLLRLEEFNPVSTELATLLTERIHLWERSW